MFQKKTNKIKKPFAAKTKGETESLIKMLYKIMKKQTDTRAKTTKKTLPHVFNIIIYKHDHKDRTVLELEEKELTLIAFLIEKSHLKLKDKMENPLSSRLHVKLQDFISK